MATTETQSSIRVRTFIGALLASGAMLVAAPASIALAEPDEGGSESSETSSSSDNRSDFSRAISDAITAHTKMIRDAVKRIPTAAHAGNVRDIEDAVEQIQSANDDLQNAVQGIVEPWDPSQPWGMFE